MMHNLTCLETSSILSTGGRKSFWGEDNGNSSARETWQVFAVKDLVKNLRWTRGASVGHRTFSTMKCANANTLNIFITVFVRALHWRHSHTHPETPCAVTFCIFATCSKWFSKWPNISNGVKTFHNRCWKSPCSKRLRILERAPTALLSRNWMQNSNKINRPTLKKQQQR